MPSRRSLLALALCVAVAIAIVAPAAAQLKMPPEETVAFLKKTLTADAAKFNRHVADVATEITSMGKYAAFDDLVNSIGASTARSKQDEVVAAVLPGLNKAAADGLQLGPKSFLAVALAARARKPLNAAKVNELVFALAEKSKVQALDKYEKAALVEILEWRKAGMAVVDGKIVSTAAAARTEAAAASIVKTVRSELDAASVGRLQELLPAKNGYTTATAKDFFVDAERLGTADNNIYDCFRVAKVSAPANSVYESRLTAIADMMKSGKHSTDQEADAFAKVIYNVFQKSKAGKSPLSAAENELLEAAPKYFHIIDSANAEAVAFLKRIPIASSSNLAPGVGRAAEASSKWPVITVPTSIPRAAARNARAEIDKAIRDAGSRAWSRMSMPKGPERGVGAKPDMFRLWTKSKNTIDTYSTLDAFKAYSKKVPSGPLALERETSSIAYSAHNYQVIMADYIRSGKPVAFDDLTTMARAIKTKVEKYNGVLSPYDKEFLTAYGELVDSIGKTRFVWRDGMVLTSEESTELYTIAKALHDRKFTTYEQYSSAMSDTQAAMMKEISYFGKPKAVPASVDFEQVIRRPGESNVSLIDVINADRQWLTASDNAARAADANKPLTRLKNWITTGSQYLP